MAYPPKGIMLHWYYSNQYSPYKCNYFCTQFFTSLPFKSKLFFLVMRAYRVCVLPCACMYMRACIEELEYLLAALTDTRSHTGLLHKA